MKIFWQKYKHSLMFLYFGIYLPWFFWLESRADQPYHVIHMGLDDHIPFLEIFIIPYLLWFGYVAVVFAYLFFKNTEEFYRYCIFLFAGMTLFLVISTVYPNGHLLRPAAFERDNIFTQAVQVLYQTDTATNIFPSIHVFNSVAAHMALIHTPQLHGKRWLHIGSFVLMVSIVLSTVFLKQHSMLDLIAGVGLGFIVNQLVYHTDYSFVREKYLQRKRKPARI